MSDGSGLKTATELAVAAADEAPASARQLPLLPAEELDGLPEGVARTAALRSRGPGRPPGARNRKTTAWRDFLLARYASPLQALAETIARPVHDLAAELGCERLEAFQLQLRAAVELAPYLHGKMPVEVKVTGELPILQLVDPRVYVSALPGAEGVAVANLASLQPLLESEDFQGVACGDQGGVGQPELDNAAETAESCASPDAAPQMQHLLPPAAAATSPAPACAQGGTPPSPSPLSAGGDRKMSPEFPEGAANLESAGPGAGAAGDAAGPGVEAANAEVADGGRG